MSTKFYTLLTDIGAAKLASAAALGVPLKITHMAVGDGGGVLPTPDAKQTALVNEKRRAALNMLYIDPQNSSQIIAEQVIPENEGGWWIREVGLFDESGALIAVGNCPESYKPQLAEGSGRTQTVRMVLITSSTDNITLKIDPAVVLATRKYVDDKVLELKLYVDDQMRNHIAAQDPHTQYAQKHNPTFTGEPKAPTPAAGNNTTRIATTEFVQAAITALINGAPATLDTLKEIAAAINNDPKFSTTINNALSGKQPLDETLTHLSGKDVAGLLAYLGLVNNGAVGRLIGMQIIKTSGTYTKTPGAMFADVIAIGGGGGGGWATSTGNYNAAGGGGGGGGMARGLFNLSAISTVLVTIGAGGNGGIASTITNGTQGGTTTFGSYLSAGGGQPGNGCTASGSSASCGMGGQGGTSTVGALLCNGHAGLPGVMATPTAVGGTVSSGLGGGSFISGPGGYGAGGNGAATSGGAQNVNGNPGNAGVIIILEYA
ncbi:Phage tail-collar fibre protein [Escherichia coli]|nr:phage tail protein [Escherichia coli]VTX96757.1 Phage tail-collar fibre protein [Escherichia coli]